MSGFHYFTKVFAVRLIHVFGLLALVLGGVCCCGSLLLFFVFPSGGAFLSAFGSGMSLLLLAALLAGFELLVRAAACYLESKNENV